MIRDHLAGEPAVANMSLGGSASTTLDLAVQALIDDGVTVVAAAGNDAAPSCNDSPGRVAAAITVAASTADDDDADFSNYGACNDLFAPGVGILSASNASNSATATLSGTSMAAPHVAGAAALILQTSPSATPAQIWTTMEAATTKGVLSECCGDPDKLLYVGQPSFVLSVSSSGAGTVSSLPSGIDCPSSCSALFVSGSDVTLTATPSVGSVFDGWSGACMGTGSCTVTMNAARSVMAAFVPLPSFVLSVSSSGAGTVSSLPSGIDCPSSCSALFVSGSDVTLTATPDAGVAFDGWSGACTGTGSCTVTINAARSVMAAFVLPPAVESSPTLTVTPARLFDSRPIGARGAGSVTEVQVAGRGGVPANAVGAMLNVTVVEAQGPGYATVFPCGEAQPDASNLNYAVGQTIPNAVFAKLGAAGSVCIYTYSPVQILVDVNGYVPSGSDVKSVTPARLFDSRSTGVRPGGSVTMVQVAGSGGVPSGSQAAMLNVTVVEAQAPGYATVYPCDQIRPDASNLNYATGGTIPNAVFAKLDSSGRVCLYTYAPVHLLVDVNGYVPVGSKASPVNPFRAYDSRPIGARGAGSVTEVQIAGIGGVPGGSRTATLNVTVVEAQAPGYATVYPCDQIRPDASNLNYATGGTIPNAVFAKLDSSGRVCIYTYATVHLLVDVNGYVP